MKTGQPEFSISEDRIFSERLILSFLNKSYSCFLKLQKLHFLGLRTEWSKVVHSWQGTRVRMLTLRYRRLGSNLSTCEKLTLVAERWSLCSSPGLEPIPRSSFGSLTAQRSAWVVSPTRVAFYFLLLAHCVCLHSSCLFQLSSGSSTASSYSLSYRQNFVRLQAQQLFVSSTTSSTLTSRITSS